MEPVFRALEIAAKGLVAVTGTAITFEGLDHLPARGGAVLAINHTGYVDWLPAALAAERRGRRMRFMIKAEMQQVRVVDFLIRHTGTIPVDRRAGATAYAAAVSALRGGEIVGVYPEATISRSFELKEFKSGAARMSLDAGVPIVPVIVWGSQRIWTKDHPRAIGHRRVPVTVAVGEAIAPTGSVEQIDAAMRRQMTEVLDDVAARYPQPPGAFWLPRRLGGGAPTLQEARRRDEAELAARRRRRSGSR